MRLPEHSRKGNEVSDDDNEDIVESRDHGNRLNHVYQGSLRESGSTLRTPIVGVDATSGIGCIFNYCTIYKIVLSTVVNIFMVYKGV